MWFILVMHFQMGDFLMTESCIFIKEFMQSCGSFGSCKTKLAVVWLNQHNIFLEMGVMWIMEVNISINYASVWFFPLGCYIPQSRVQKYYIRDRPPQGDVFDSFTPILFLPLQNFGESLLLGRSFYIKAPSQKFRLPKTYVDSFLLLFAIAL